MKKEQDKERIEEIMKEFENRFEAIMTYWGAAGIIKEIKNYIGQILTQQKEDIEREWRDKIKNVKYDYPKSENQKEHERNIDIIERTVNQIKNQLLQ